MNKLVASILLIILSPLLFVIGISIFIFDGFPIIFKQERVGLNCKLFVIYKFRSLKSDQITPIYFIGNLIRFLKLDELLNLFNVINGSMNFIGPRPLKSDYLRYYSKTQIKRHKIKPGLTGLTQVSKKACWKKYFQLDLYYLRKKSILLNIFIIFKTLVVFFFLRYKPLSKNKRFNGKN